MTEINLNRIHMARILFRNKEVGLLKKQEENQFSFQYSSQYISSSNAQPIATTLPLGLQPIVSKKLHPFFDNLIAEGWLLECAEKILHIDKKNRFALLMATGKSVIGAVSVEPLDENGRSIDIMKNFKEENYNENLISYPSLPLENFPYCPICFDALEEKKNHKKCALEVWGTTRDIKIRLNEKQPLQSFARTIYGGSISGAQRKGLFYLNLANGNLTPTAIDSQYILKPNGNYPELPENEHVTMAIAKKVGFAVPPFTLLKIENFGHIFAIKRFDKTANNEPLMMEDMGQITQTHSDDKYRSSYEKIAKAIQKYSSAPLLDLTDFFRRILFCYITANADMHLKNWSLLENKNALGSLVLSSCYDLLNTRIAIPEEKIDLGLTMLGKARNLKKSYFKEFAANIHLSPARVNKIFDEIPQWKKIVDDIVPISLLSQESKKEYLNIVNLRVNALSVP
ncbi:MAG: type II toxin-antitoxin system HipA family toxin [Bdellovibrionota bacterium]